MKREMSRRLRLAASLAAAVLLPAALPAQSYGVGDQC